MARDPKKLDKIKDHETTAKIKAGVYNNLVKIRTAGESISDVIERLFLAHKSCSKCNREGK